MMNPLARRLVMTLMLACVFVSAYFLIGVTITTLIYFFGVHMAGTIFMGMIVLVLLWIIAGVVD